MNILLSTDNNYTMPTGVLMHSISINNGPLVSYHILVDEDFSDQNKSALEHIAKTYGNQIYFYVVTRAMTESLPFGRDNQPHHVSIATYYRLFITEILPDSVHKVIYLDGDMIVRKSLAELWETDLTDFALGVVHDMDEPVHVSSHRLPYPMEEGYFNAGMLIVNLDYWRDNDCFEQFMLFVEHYSETIRFHDQDVLNCVFYNKKKWLSTTFNFQSGFIYIPEYQRQYNEDLSTEINHVKFDPVVIHFATKDKPWRLECFHPHSAVWRYYWRKSQWRDTPLIGDNPNSLKSYVRNFCLRHNLYMPKCGYQRIILRR